MSLFDLPPAVADLANSDEAVFVVNIDGVVVLMSPAAEKLAGVAADDMIGEFVEMLVPSSKRWGHQAYRRGYFAEPNEREMDPGLEPELERPDGTLVPIHSHLVPMRIDGTLYVAAHLTERTEGAA
jgi:PAS domain S-box-containing protein